MRHCVWCGILFFPSKSPNFCSEKCKNFWMAKVDTIQEVKVRPEGYVPTMLEQLQEIVGVIHKEEDKAKEWERKHPFTSRMD